MFNYDWFHGAAFAQQKQEARDRCLRQHFPDVDFEDVDATQDAAAYREGVEERALIYLRDGFSYEIREVADVTTKSHLVFECVPVDEQYKAGTFIVTVPFDEIVRVEIFAVHATEKPNDVPQITGFRSYAEHPEGKHPDGGPAKPPR